ncbi:hypothetical protein [Pedobacter arcticus]|uniref:hypothetical protein n=1 Tax=Pedobacter arcticus TaxID=752140 RepID=UPI00036F873B|nr:hypothetical protein [Pedobacter arcticus]
MSETPNFEAFQNHIVPKTQLNASVQEPIIKYYNITKQLIIYSYFEYEFLTVALRESLLLMELTLNVYYEKVNGIECKLMLAKSLKWFKENKFIKDEEGARVLDLIRLIRNHHMHPSKHIINPPSVVDIIDLIIVWINKLDKRVNKQHPNLL